MKIVMVGPFAHKVPEALPDEQRVARALERAGAEIVRCEPPWNDVEDVVRREKPDWVLFSKCREIRPRQLEDLRREHRVRLAQILFDLMDFRERRFPRLPWPTRSRLDWWLPMARRMDVVFHRERGHLERYASLGVRGFYLDQASDIDDGPADSYPESARCDIAFLGRYRPGPARLLAEIGVGHKVIVYTPDGRPWRGMGFDVRPEVHDRPLAEAIAGASMVFGESARHDVDGYWSDRVYLVLGHRGFFLTRYTPGLENFFRNGEHLVWFETGKEAVAAVERYLSDQSARSRIAAAGFRHVRAHHTYDHRASEILGVLSRVG